MPWLQRALGPFGTLPKLGFKPNAPVKLAGMRIDPPPSLAVTRGRTSPASAAAEPPLEPPGVRAGSQGDRVTPKRRFLVTAMCPNSGVFVLPTTMAPAPLRRSTWIESSVATRSRKRRDPCEVTSPAASSRSLTPRGTPSRGRARPRAMRPSARRASAMSSSRERRETTAFSRSCVSPIRSRVISMSSVGDRRFAWIASVSSFRVERSGSGMSFAPG